MKKGRLLILLMIFAVSSFATESRVGSMGGVGYYMRDNSNVFHFPATICNYSQQVVGELRAKNNVSRYTTGLHMPLSEGKVIGLYLNSPLNIPPISDDVYVNRTTDLFFGTRTANMNVAFKLSVGFDKITEESGSTEEKESATYLALGAGVSNEQMDLGFVLEMPSQKWELEKASRKWGGIGLGVNARFFTQEQNGLRFVPLGMLYFQPTSIEYDSGITGVSKDKTDYSVFNLGVGVGINYQLNEKNLVVAAIEAFGMSNVTESVKEGDESTISCKTMPGLYFGVESHVTKWLTGRLGAAQVFQSYTYTDKPNEGKETSSTSYSSQFKVTFGLGVQFGKFALDASINEGLLFDGPNVLSGADEPLAHRLSITYSY